MELKVLHCDSKETFHIVLNCEYWNNCFYLKQYFLQLFKKCCSYSVGTAFFKKLALILSRRIYTCVLQLGSGESLLLEKNWHLSCCCIWTRKLAILFTNVSFFWFFHWYLLAFEAAGVNSSMEPQRRRLCWGKQHDFYLEFSSCFGIKNKKFLVYL